MRTIFDDVEILTRSLFAFIVHAFIWFGCSSLFSSLDCHKWIHKIYSIAASVHHSSHSLYCFWVCVCCVCQNEMTFLSCFRPNFVRFLAHSRLWLLFKSIFSGYIVNVFISLVYFAQLTDTQCS